MLLAISIHDCTVEKQVLLLALFFSLHFIKVIFFPSPISSHPRRISQLPRMWMLILGGML